MQSFSIVELHPPLGETCTERHEDIGCNQPAVILCDLCNALRCKSHSWYWTYPTFRGYPQGPQKALCGECMLGMRVIDAKLLAEGDADDDPGYVCRLDSDKWEPLREPR